MNNTDTLEKIIRHQKNKDPAYPFREHLLMQLCIRTNKRMQDNISEFLGVYGINHSAYMVLTTLFAAENHCLSPSEISQKLQFTRTNITRIIWDYLTHDEQELFEVINKKLLAHFSDASS